MSRKGELIGGRSIFASTHCPGQPRDGVELEFFGATSPVTISLASTRSQDLLLDLGPPLRRYYEEDDCLGHSRSPSATQGCWWNYFNLGIDYFVEDGFVTKIMLHSNIVSLGLNGTAPRSDLGAAWHRSLSATRTMPVVNSLIIRRHFSP